MSDNRRVIEMYADVEASNNKSSDNALLRDSLTIFCKSQTVIRCHLRLTDGATYLLPPAGAEWLFVINDVYASGSPCLVTVDNAQFNTAADWPGTSGLDVANGRICFRVDSDVAALRTALAGAASKDMVGEVWYFVGSDPKMLACQFPITIRNIVSDST